VVILPANPPVAKFGPVRWFRDAGIQMLRSSQGLRLQGHHRPPASKERANLLQGVFRAAAPPRTPQIN